LQYRLLYWIAVASGIDSIEEEEDSTVGLSLSSAECDEQSEVYALLKYILAGFTAVPGVIKGLQMSVTVNACRIH
jgi:hypothetical protein